MQKILISVAIGINLIAGAGCTTHQLDIQQGNVIEAEAVDRLEIGMSKRQVKFLLGTSLLTDPFQNQRWNYVYWLKKSRQPAESQQLTLYFDDEKLNKIISSEENTTLANEQ